MDDFLKHIPAKSRTLIEVVLDDDDMTIGEKLEHLSDYGISSEIVRLAEKFLNNEPLVDVNFLSHLPNTTVKLAQHYIIKGIFPPLDKLMVLESKEVQDLYRAFKEYYAKDSSIVQKIIGGKLDINQSKMSKVKSHAPGPGRKVHRPPIDKSPFDSTDEETEEDDDVEEEDIDPDWVPSITPEFFAKYAELVPNLQAVYFLLHETAYLRNNTAMYNKLYRFPECLNILILGETGVGKSTFINGLGNYLKHSNMYEAKKNGVEILIKSRFIHMDEDYNRMRIDCEPTVTADYDEGENEDVQDGESSTQSPKAYQFEWGTSENRKRIRIIDTPGVGDVRGLSQEKENFAKILQFIADYKEIHAILILLKPNNARLTVTLRFCINELLTHLHSSASKNILFCFTNARQTLYKPGDTLPALTDHLDQLHEARGIRIPLQHDTVFCFDNESFRFLSAWKSGAQFEQEDIKNFDDSWKTTVNETFRLFKKISTLKSHKTEDTLSINNIRAVILAMARPLAEIAKSLMANAQLIDDKVKEVEDLLKQGKSLATAQLQVEQVSLITKEVDYPTTVCTSDKCIELVKLGADMWEAYYKQKCHHMCGLTGVQTGVVPNPQIKSCACFGCGAHIDRCAVCHCDWTTHLHIRYELQRIVKNVVDPSVQDSIKNNDDKVKTAQLFIDAEKKRKQDLERESKKISSHCIEFAAFLKRNSIIPYNDVYKEYVEHLIREENAKVSQGGSNKMLQQLQKYRDEYEQQVKILEGHGSSSYSNRSISEIYKMLEDLKNMKNCGSLLQEIQKLEMLSVRQEQTNRVLNVNISKGWLDGMHNSSGGAKSSSKMSVSDLIGHLPESIQKQIDIVIHDEDSSLNEKVEAIGLVVEDKAIIRKCYQLLKKKDKADRKIRDHLKSLDAEHHEIARAILMDEALSMMEKLNAFQTFTSNTDYLKATLKFLQTFAVKEKEEETEYKIARIPPADYPLNDLDETTRNQAEIVLEDELSSNVEKLELLSEFVYDREILRQFKRLFRQQYDEKDFLDQFPEDKRGELASLLREISLDFDEKKNLLRYILKTPEDRKKCRKYFKEQEKALIQAATKDISDCESEQDDGISQLNLEFLERCPDEMNILILGETGVGKSTFLNGIANYMKYRTLHEANSNQDVEVLITCHFTHTGDGMKQDRIVCKSEDDVGNENLKTGESCTLAARTYVFKWNVRGRTKQIRLIDTPGVGDVAGFKRDQENFDNIFHHLADFKELHGICILMKPNESKLNASFTYCLGELLSKLHLSARKNLLFCFTNTRGTLFRPGESMAILNAYMKELEKKRDLQIPLNRASLFCFDNESFRFLCAWKKGIKFSDGHIADFNASWKRSVREVFRFFTRITQLLPHSIADTLCINNVRKVFDILTKPISQMNTKQMAIDKVLDDELATSEAVTKEIAAEKKNLQRDQFTITRVKSGRIDTVCSSATCSPPHPESATEKLLKVCHQSCTCVRARLDTCQDTNLQRCSCMNQMLRCNNCNCLWTCHMQIDWQLQIGTHKVVDATIQAKIDQLQVKLAASNRTITQATANKTAAVQESSKLKTQSVELVSYLTTFAVLPHNENLKEYVEKLINEEKQKIGLGKPNTDLLYLEQVLAAHEAQIKILSETTVTKSTKTEEEISLMLNQLKNEPTCASAQADIEKMIVLQVRNKPMFRSKEVDLNNGWIGELFQ